MFPARSATATTEGVLTDCAAFWITCCTSAAESGTAGDGVELGAGRPPLLQATRSMPSDTSEVAVSANRKRRWRWWRIWSRSRDIRERRLRGIYRRKKCNTAVTEERRCQDFRVTRSVNGEVR